MQKTETPLTFRLWTVDEYYLMTEAGILNPEERVELIEGQVIRMAAKGIAHVIAGKQTQKLLENLLAEKVLVWMQDPIRLNNYSEPEPDIALVMPPLERYLDHHPTASEVYLIIEIADTTFRIDRDKKAKAYSRSGIADYWVLDIVERQLHVFREPSEAGYQNEIILSETESISLLVFPDVSVIVGQMLPPPIP
ncbi:MAG: Uma2 family endonuclease [Okeania sp. SIO3I5]|uniref:Uma2 family endonuclease n=1 Tax=Okeania sp. SIO3I5 TaxID=2607805 RepID=UPI0013BB5301|nr:Uma2 family endonuclease [Okeania sp. SIO3I5]NEQ39919.1 Uma2 family endonuclease [Okeania sp. SIO3I5]